MFEFLLLSFYLLNEGYEIEEHPKLLFKIDAPEYISEGIFKDATRAKYGTKPNGAVAWSDRRAYSDNLSFIKRNNEIMKKNLIYAILVIGLIAGSNMACNAKRKTMQRMVFLFVRVASAKRTFSDLRSKLSALIADKGKLLRTHSVRRAP